MSATRENKAWLVVHSRMVHRRSARSRAESCNRSTRKDIVDSEGDFELFFRWNVKHFILLLTRAG